MNGKALSEALGGLPEAMVAEAMKPHSKRNHSFWLRLAACVVLIVGLFFGLRPDPQGIVTAPGILAVTVYAVDEDSETGFSQVQLKEGIGTGYTNIWPLGLSTVPGIPVMLSVDSWEFSVEDIVFDVTVDSGGYCDMDEGIMAILPSRFTKTNRSIIYWNDEPGEHRDESDHAERNCVYTDIIIYCDDHIIGYAVLCFDETSENNRIYETNLVTSVCFPKEFGQFQNVPMEYVLGCIAEVKE